MKKIIQLNLLVLFSLFLFQCSNDDEVKFAQKFVWTYVRDQDMFEGLWKLEFHKTNRFVFGEEKIAPPFLSL